MNAIFGFFARIIGWVLSALYGVIDNYGISIIVLTLLIRLAMVPLYAKQMKSSAKMSEAQSKIKDIQTRYANNREKMNEEMQKLYSEEGINPTSGCLPLLIQMPILLGLFQLLRNPLTYMTGPDMVVAVHEAFLWVKDLCQPDSWILPILAGASTYFTFSMMPQQEGAGMGMSNMKYFYPILIFLIGRSFPAGLALYWAIGNVFTIGQNFFFNRKKKKEKFRKEAEEEVLKNRKQQKTTE